MLFIFLRIKKSKRDDIRQWTKGYVKKLSKTRRKNFKNQIFRRIFFHPIKLPTCEIKSGTGKKQKGRHVTEQNGVR